MMNKWISVKKELPETGKQYLCCDTNGFREVGYFSTSGEWSFADNDYMDEVIAWMPLPEPYVEDENER